MTQLSREVELDLKPQRLPGIVWLAAGPPLITAVLIWWLAANRSELPWRTPEAPRMVAYSLALWNMMSLWTVCAALACWYGMASSFTPRRLQLVGAVSNQWSNLIFLIATNLVLWIELPAWALVLCIAAGAAALCSTVYRAHLANRAIERNAVRFGYGLYFDSADPAIMGHRGMNLASGWTWLLIVTGFLPGLLASWLLNGLN